MSRGHTRQGWREARGQRTSILAAVQPQMCTEKHLVDVCDSKYSLTGAATPEQQCPRRKGGGTKDFTCGAQLLSFLGKLYKSSPTSTYKTNSDHMLQQQRKPGRPYFTSKDTIVKCLVLLPLNVFLKLLLTEDP